MSYWIFKCNPDEYRIDERLKDAEPTITWRITRYKDEIKKRDIAFIWRTGAKRGLCAIIRIESDPREMQELDSEQKYNFERDIRIRMRIEGKFTNRFDCISHKQLRNTRGLENLSVFSGYRQTTNFRVTDEEGRILLTLAEEVQRK